MSNLPTEVVDRVLASPYAAPEVKEVVQRRSWRSEAGPQQTKKVNLALSALAQEHNTITELIGVVGGDEQRFSRHLPFGHNNRTDVSQVQLEIGNRFDFLVTRGNYQQIIDAVHAALPALKENRPISDKRRTAEDIEQQRQKAAEREAQQQQREVEIVEAARLLALACPWALPLTAPMSREARVAANLKTELTRAFPGIVFSVKSSRSAVDYRWELGPREADVSAIADKYAYGEFDSMQDLATEDRSIQGEAVDRVLGRVRFVHGRREIPDTVRSQVEQLLCEAQRVAYAGPQTPNVFGQGDSRWLSDHVREILTRTTFPLRSEIDGIVWKDSGYDELSGEDVDRSGYYLTFKACEAALAAPATAAAGVSVTENIGKNGIEIRFDSKPPQGTLDQIHAQGHGVWRWHKKGKFWYAKANETTRTFAQSLLSGGGA